MPEGSAATMRAAVLHGAEDMTIEHVPVPVPGPGEVRIRVEAALTGGTSAKVYQRGYHARMGQPPLRFGHEGAGVIDAVGENVEGWTVGDRVVPANSASCGKCAACEHGHTAQCQAMIWLNGFFAEFLVVPARIVAANMHRVPPGLASEAAALAEILATVVKGHDRTPARRGERVLVIGSGPLGLLWIRLLSVGGARVTAVDPRAERREAALVLGAEQALAPSELDPGSIRTDLVVEAVGSTKTWEAAIAAATPGSRVHLFGGPPQGTKVALDAQRLHYDELLITASFHHTPFHFADALRLLAEGFVDPSVFIQEHLVLEELPAFFARAAKGDGPLKAAVVP